MLRLRLLAALAAVPLLLPAPASGYLGSFEEQDGYRVPGNGNMVALGFAGDAQFYLGNNPANGFTGIVPPGALPHTLGDATHGADLSRFNAGQYGTNNGGPGGTGTDIADNTGLWQAIAGGRLNEDIDAPFYNGGLGNRDYVQAYSYPGARTGSQVLNLLASDTNLQYRYNLDDRDFNGVSPASTIAHSISVSFWLCPSDWDDHDPGNILGLSFQDALGQTMLELGYTGDNLLQFRLPGQGAWQTTAFALGTQGWSQLEVDFNTWTDEASLAVRAWDDATGILGATSAVFADAALGLDADALTHLTWDLRGGALDEGVVGFKHYFDDFSLVVVPVPEPGSALLVALLGLLALSVRRRRQSAPKQPR